MIAVLLILLAVVALVWAWFLLGPDHRRAFAQVLDASTPLPDAPLPPVSVIVPARNEARVLGSTVPTICRQEYPDLRVILVDDQSDDDSPRVIARLLAEQPRLTCIAGTPRPAGWHGKQWAVHQGLQLASTDWLLFTDADILFHPQALRQTMRFALANHLEMVSLLPQLIFSTTAERLALSAAMAVIATLFPLSRANDPRSPVAIAAGGFILIRRDAYRRVGGHEAVRDRMIEDLSLAQKLKSAGTRMQTRLTRDLLATRMYEDWPDLWEGLSKNAYAGIGYSPWKFLAGIVAGLLVGILPPLYLLGSLIAAAVRPTWQTGLATALSALILAMMIAVHRRPVRHLRLPWYYVLLLPIGGLLYSLFVFWSVYQHHFAGGALWKGRRYA